MIVFLYLILLFSDISKNFDFSFFISNLITENISYLIGIALILINIYSYSKSKKVLNVIQKRFLNLNFLLIISYFLSLICSLIFSEVSTLSSFLHFFYAIIPIVFLNTFILLYPININLVYKINRYLIYGFIFIILVAIIQNTFSPNFLLNTTYIERNDLVNTSLRNVGFETFTRIKSIYASADRFSTISLSIICASIFNFALSNKSQKKFKVYKFHSILGFLMGTLGILLAGKRIILFLLILSLLITLILFLFKYKKINNSFMKIKLISSKNISSYITVMIFILLFLLISQELLNYFQSSFANIGIIRLLNSGIDTQYTYEVILKQISLMPKIEFQNYFFGSGLGSLSFGKPGESSIYSTLYESGVILGPSILILLGLIIFNLFSKIFHTIKYGEFLISFALVIYSIKLLSGLFVGLTYIYEPLFFFISLPTVVASYGILDWKRRGK